MASPTASQPATGRPATAGKRCAPNASAPRSSVAAAPNASSPTQGRTPAWNAGCASCRELRQQWQECHRGPAHSLSPDAPGHTGHQVARGRPCEQQPGKHGPSPRVPAAGVGREIAARRQRAEETGVGQLPVAAA